MKKKSTAGLTFVVLEKSPEKEQNTLKDSLIDEKVTAEKDYAVPPEPEPFALDPALQPCDSLRFWGSKCRRRLPLRRCPHQSDCRYMPTEPDLK
jgi:hypothetical protein